MSANAGGIRAGRAFVELFADDSKLVRGLHSAEKKLKAFGTATREIGTKMMAAGAAITAPLAASAYAFAKAGSEMAEMSARTGVSVEALSALKFAAGQSGVEIESLETGLRKMQRSIFQAANGSAAAKTALAQLGLTVADLANLSPDEQFKRIAEAMSRIQDPAVRTGLAMQLFGRSGTAMLPMMEQGAAGLNRMATEAAGLGLIMSTQSAEAAHAFEKRLTILSRVMAAGRNAIGSALVPAMTDLTNKLIASGATIVKWIKQHQEIVVQVMRTGAIIVGVGGALVGLGYAFTGLARGLGVLASGISAGVTGFKLIGGLLAWALNPAVLLAAGVLALAGYLVYASGIGGKALAWLGERFGTLFDDASVAWKAIGDALSKGDIGKAAQVLWATLRMEWQRGKAGLERIWADFSFGLLATMEIAWDGIVKGWINAVAQIKTTFAAVNGWVNKEAQKLAGEIAKVLVKFENSRQEADRKQTQEQLQRTDLSPDERARLQRHWEDIKTPGGPDEATQNAVIDQSVKQANAAIDADTAKAVANAETQRKQRLAGEQAVHDQTMANLAKENQGKIDAAQAEVDAAQKAWKESLVPSGKPTLTGSGAAAPTLNKSMAALKGLDLMSLGKKIEAHGSFNVMEARGLGAGGAADRIAAATEQTAANTQKIIDQMGDGAEFE